MLVKHLRKIMNLHQRTIIGTGSRATVYSLTEHWVIRESKFNTDGFLAIYTLTDLERKKYKLPIIDKLNSSLAKGIITVEKLYKLDPTLFNGINIFYERLNNVFNLNSNINYKNFKLRDYLDKSHHLYDITNTAIKLHEHLKDKGILTSLHLSSENIMMRGTGGLILSDPFSIRKV